jgi:D-alanine transaminase
VLAKQKAREAGAFEAWFVDRDGFVTEGASTNAWIVTGAGSIVTRAADHAILSGITRAGVVDLAAIEKRRFEERPFTVAEALVAGEAFITSAGTIVTPVVEIDGNKVGNGKPGPVARRLRSIFHEHAQVGGAWATPQGADTLQK